MSKFFLNLCSKQLVSLIFAITLGLLQMRALAVPLEPLATVHDAPLVGSWSQACAVVGEDEDWLTSHLDFSGQEALQITWTRRAYEEENCQKPYLDYSILYRSVFSQTGTLDLVVQKAIYIVHTDEVARALNLIGYCGIKKWKKSVPQEVSGKDCDGYLQPAVGQLLFTRAKLEMRQSKMLFWGRSSAGFDGQKPESRFQEFEDVGYQEVRQKNRHF